VILAVYTVLALARWRGDPQSFLEFAAWLAAPLAVALGLGGLLLLEIRRVERDHAASADSEHRFRMAVEAARCGIWEWDLTADQIFMSETTADLFGWRRGLYEGQQVLERVSPGHRDGLRDALSNAALHGDFDVSFRVPSLAGARPIWIDARGRGFGEAPEGGFARIIGVALDVTERMWEPGALFEAEAKYQGLVETIPAVTYIDPLDEWGDSLYVSPQVTELLGYTQEDWLTDPGFWRDHVHPGDADRVWEEWVRARDSGSPYQSEYRMLHRDGHEVWVSERAVMLKDAAGRPWAVQGVMVDITERKRVEEELERAWQREREAAAHLRDLDDMKNLLLHAVAHDLRGPIATVLGSAMVLENSLTDLDDDKRDLIRGVAAGAHKLNRLVNDLLDLERLERGLVEPDRRSTDVGELARRVVAELNVKFHEVQVETENTVSAVDPVQVERIIENLVVNSARHTPKGTPIWVRVHRRDEGTQILVEDAGPGVPQDLREVIFEPFRHGGEGLGIGLSLVARFATLHGGWARVGDREGGGASFEVFLPDGAVVAEAVPDGVGLAAS